MGVVATNVLKEVCKEYSDEIEMQEASITEILVLQEQVKMELLSNKNHTKFWPDATLPVGWQNGRLTIILLKHLKLKL